MTDLVIDVADARRIDATAIERLGIPGLLLMEHAAIGVATIVRREAAIHGLRRLRVLVGNGGNGGDGWAVARLLHLAGLDVEVHELGGTVTSLDASTNRTIARALGIPNRRLVPDEIGLDAETLIVDAMFGIGLGRPLEGIAAEVAPRIEASPAVVVAVDVPSGFDATVGRPPGIAMRADVTATMVAPKRGMMLEGAERWIGRIETVDIGIPLDFVLQIVGLAQSHPVDDTVARD